MKLLYDYQAFAMQSRGGVSRVMYELIKYGLDQPGVECSVWGGIHQNFSMDDLVRKYPRQARGIKMPNCLSKARVLRGCNKYLFPFYARRYQPDICHYTFFTTAVLPARTKVVVTVHDLITELFPQHYARNDKQARLRAKALKKADGVICVSEHTRSDLLRLYDLDESRVVVAYNGNSLDKVPDPVVPSLEKPYFLFVGARNGWRKNFDVILRALVITPELKDIDLVCFGSIRFSVEEIAHFKSIGLADRIHYFGGNDAVLAGFYCNALGMIYPSRYEGFGLPPVEAMSLGCPVISSSAPPMPEIIGSAAIFFDSESEEELSVALLQCVGDSGFRETLIAKGREQAKLFSWEKSCEKVYKLYDRLLV